jgi:hypothetical protein
MVAAVAGMVADTADTAVVGTAAVGIQCRFQFQLAFVHQGKFL